MLSNLSSPWSRILGFLFLFTAFEVWILPNFQRRFFCFPLVFPYEFTDRRKSLHMIVRGLDETDNKQTP